MQNLGRVLVSAIGLVTLTGLASCGGSDSPPSERAVKSLRLIGQQVLPRRLEFQGTVVGGLSGVEYDANNSRFIFMSDDRTMTDSANPPRFYTAALTFNETTFSAVQFLSTVTLKQPDGSVFPKVPDVKVADPESIRLDPVSGNLLWTSEGDRFISATAPRIIDPFVREMRSDGTFVREYALPSMFRMSASDTGPRGNLAFEGLAVTPDKTRTVVLAEGPLFTDGPVPTVSAGAVSRITVFDRATGAALTQYAYPVEKVQAVPVPATAFSVSGATEILAITNNKFLVLERSFSVGVEGNRVRLYEIDVGKASNVLGTAALVAGTYTPVTKRLVLDFETLKAQLGGIANLEGMTFGPKLANGRDTLVVVADDNFPAADSTTDRNQILVFEVMPD